MKKASAIRLLTVALAAACGLMGQKYIPVTPTPRSPGLSTPEIEPFQTFTSIDDMTRFSDLIMEGTVISSGPTVRLDANPSDPILETDSVIAISRTFRDAFWTARSPASQMILVQLGGKFDGWDVQPKGIPLVQPDEEYILFLRQVCGAVPWNQSGLPRYEALGAWAGLLKVVNRKVQFLPKAAPALHESDGLNVEVFSERMEEKIGKLPKHSLAFEPSPNFHPTATARKPCPVESPH